MKHTKCIIEGCYKRGVKRNGAKEEYFPRGYCCSHYSILIKFGDPLTPPKFKSRLTNCKVEGCDSPITDKTRIRHGFCGKHSYRFEKHGNPHTIKHHVKGQSKHKLYRTYVGMKNRCYNKNEPSYKDYGERGIIMCDRWLGTNGFFNFIEDMGDKPINTSIDRIDNNKGYFKENCKWSTVHQQASNKRACNDIVGIKFNKDKDTWTGRITINRKQIGKSFKTKEEAIAYRKELEIKYLKND